MDFTYIITRSHRRSMAIRIETDGRVLVSCPAAMSEQAVAEFVESKSRWIQKHLMKLRSVPREPVLTQAQLDTIIRLAKQVIPAKVALYAPAVDVTYGRITIRKQRTRWGSCSSKGNLNFNCLLMLAPEAVVDYVVVHELCHRKEMNHSKAFWENVEAILPDYRTARQWLKEHGFSLMSRIQNLEE